MEEGALLWRPRAHFAQNSNLAQYMRWLRTVRGVATEGYDSLWRWSVADLDGFWGSIWDYFEIESDARYRQVIDRRVMPGAHWFDGARLNYAEHLLRYERRAAPDETALHHQSETRPLAAMSWQELGRQVRIVANQLRVMGVQPGDAVVSYMPNVPETVVAMIATVAIGAVWSSAAPEFGVKTVIDRFGQLAPKVIFAADGYRFGGKDYSRHEEVRRIAAQLPTLQHLVWLPYLDPGKPVPDGLPALRWDQLLDQPDIDPAQFSYERVSHDHPLWVVFSSGTTGLPKAIVHGHAGVLLEHMKLMHLHLNLRPGAAMLFYSTTGWMMWNLLIAALLTGAAAVLYDGSPAYPDADFLWQLAARTRATSFGASPTFVQIMQKAGLVPGEKYDLSSLESVIVSGAPSTPETFDWFYRCVKRDLWVTSQSGGTELCSALVGSAPIVPVYAGEIQVRMLGMDVHAWQGAGQEVFDQVGELVVTSPFPSMPLRFLNDPGDQRYREAYFDTFPGVWRHGDFIKINGRGGSYIYGRSDSTLNRYGVRIGTAEIYRALEQIDEVADSIVVCCELPGGHFFMPLFVRMKAGCILDEEMQSKIIARLREECSPRHVPDRMYAVEQIPYTLTGKKMEVPVRSLLMGKPAATAVSRDAMMNPDAIDYFIRFAQESDDYQWRSGAQSPVASADAAAAAVLKDQR